jgi:hypothetical protein
MANATRFPLSWPQGRPRTPAHQRARSKFHVQTRRTASHNPNYSYVERAGVSLTAARDFLFAELARLGARAVILSTNLELRNDGLPRAGQRQPDDPGAAVYFTHKGKEMAFACDRWHKVEDNIVAVAKTIEALRGIERWGTGDMVEAAFVGFAALPPAGGIAPPRKWWEVLRVRADVSDEVVRDRYRHEMLNHHPDRGGDPNKAIEINAAYEEFKRERGL